LEDKGLISSKSAGLDSCPMATPKDIRDKVVLELLSTERKYVQDLETLQVSKKIKIVIVVYCDDLD
jgi:cell division control protein 24